jgi:putative transcription antitermination factor YqgF
MEIMNKYYVGLDYGTKFSGLSRANIGASSKVATLWKLLETKELLDFLLEHAGEIELIVVGHSLNLHGKENVVANEIASFVEKLKREGFKVLLQDERFTSQAALAEKRFLARKVSTRKQVKKERLDAQAAVFILQSFLDMKLV